jgi:hypothetical protein
MNHIRTVMEEHMLHAVKVIEDRGKHAFTEFVHQTIQDLDASIKNGLAQVKKLIVGDTAIFQAGRILRPAQRKIRTDLFP